MPRHAPKRRKAAKKKSAIHVANSSDRTWTRHRYLVSFGAYGGTHVLVYANGAEDASEIAINYVAERWPGLLADEEVAGAYKEARAEGLSEEDAQQQAEVDTVCASSDGIHYVHSWEMSILEDPSREYLLSLTR